MNSKPKILYRYNEHMKLEKYRTRPECAPQLISHHPKGSLYRCRHASYDQSGFTTLVAAKEEEIQTTRQRLGENLAHLKQLTKESWTLERKTIK